MRDFAFNEDGELIITPSEKSAKHDFDFYVGKWKIQNKKLISRLSNSDDWSEFDADQEVELILNGLGNTDNFITSFDGETFEGRTIRVFNPETKLWSMYWVDSSTAVLQPPTVGSFEGNIGNFYTKDTFEGQDILVVFRWDKTDVEKPVWSQAFSPDQGKTWKWNWFMYSSRVLD